MAGGNNNPMDMMIGAQAVAADAEAAMTHFSAGVNLDNAGDRVGAIEQFRKAVKANPGLSEAMFRLAYLLDLSGEEDEAIKLYERVCQEVPAPVNALLNLAVLYEDREQYASAERCLRQILDTNPNHARAKLFMKDVLASQDMIIEEDNERDILKRKALMDTPVTDFELTVRARTCLKKMNIRTLGDLLRITEAELVSYKNFGESSLEEIKRMLAQRGLKLGQGVEDAHRSARQHIMSRLRGTGMEAAFNKPVSDLALSVRARKALQMLNIQSIGDLCSRTEAELMGVKNFGATSLVEVKESLTTIGLSLRILDDQDDE